MAACPWCGELHDGDQLCQRASRGLTRRSFCFLFGVGVGAMALGISPATESPGLSLRPLPIDPSLFADWLELLRPRFVCGRIPGAHPAPFTISVGGWDT